MADILRVCSFLMLLVAVTLMAASTAVFAQKPAETASLYRATTIITGQDNLSERARGIEDCLRAVLAKVSVRQAVADHPVIGQALTDPDPLVEGYDYLDRKEGIQISDEQGTRDRSFLFTTHFKPDRINRLLYMANMRPWLAERPAIAIQLIIDDGVATYQLTQSSERGWGQRAVIESLIERVGINLLLPDGEMPRASVGLSGFMSVTKDGYWSSNWALDSSKFSDTGSDAHWEGTIGSFDRVIAEAVWESARILSTLSP